MGVAIIREALPADAAALTNVITAAYMPYSLAGVDLPPVAEGISEDIRDHLTFVAEVHGTVLGGIVLVSTGEEMRIANLAMSPEASGQGLGRRLMAVAEDTARAAGKVRVELTTHVAMEAAQRFYRGLGYKEAGRDGNRVYMAKQIIPEDAQP